MAKWICADCYDSQETYSVTLPVIPRPRYLCGKDSIYLIPTKPEEKEKGKWKK